MQQELTWRVVIAGCAAVIAAIFGAWNMVMTTLVILIGLDIISGWCRAFVQRTLSSHESFRGTFKKLLIFVAVGLAAQVDKLVGTSIMRDAVVIFYCASEGLSIVENLVAAGLPVPEQLRAALAQLNGKKFEDGTKC